MHKYAVNRANTVNFLVPSVIWHLRIKNTLFKQQLMLFCLKLSFLNINLGNTLN